MTITSSKAIQSNLQPRSPRTSHKATSATSIADTDAETSALPRPTTRSRTKTIAQHHPAPPKETAITERSTGPQPSPRAPTKQSLLIALLESKRGATLGELTKATGWQAHSVRGVMSGVLRKRLGLNVQSELFDSVRHYRITTAA